MEVSTTLSSKNDVSGDSTTDPLWVLLCLQVSGHYVLVLLGTTIKKRGWREDIRKRKDVQKTNDFILYGGTDRDFITRLNVYVFSFGYDHNKCLFDNFTYLKDYWVLSVLHCNFCL